MFEMINRGERKLEAAELLEKAGVSAEVVKVNIITPLPAHEVLSSVEKTGSLWFYEECMEFNCVGRRLAADFALGGAPAAPIVLRNLGDRVPPQGTAEQLRRMFSLDAGSIAQQVREVVGRETAAGRASG